MIYLTDAQTQALAKAMARAMAHARRVSVREHIKADRFERVNQFIVSLRRELVSFGSGLSATTSKAIVAKCCDKGVWFDIGVLASPEPVLHECLLLAEREKDVLSILTQDIELSLDLAKSELTGAQLLVGEMDRINGESEAVLASLEKLF
jgi:hypothetical protein